MSAPSAIPSQSPTPYTSLTREQIIQAVAQAGVVGAGGAGFPTHVKLNAQADTVIANGCECEPLLHGDQYLMQHEPERIVLGLRLAMRAVGAKRGTLALKKKYAEAQTALAAQIAGDPMLSLYLAENVYPIGDEQILVYAATGRRIPPGGIPPQAGVVVQNVATLYQIAQAVTDIPVTYRYVTVAGDVNQPKVMLVPIGTPIRELIQWAGGCTVDDAVPIMGGPMMGQIVRDFDTPVTKTTSAVIVLSADHPLILQKTVLAKRSRSSGSSRSSAKSVCHQCGTCDWLCPRRGLGHAISPRKLSRHNQYLPTEINFAYPAAVSCSGCGLCQSYACSMGLSPLSQAKEKKQPGSQSPELAAVPQDKYLVPTGRLTARLGLARYARSMIFDPEEYHPTQIILPLKQHVGESAVPIVKIGDKVVAGQLVADIPAGKLGAKIHSSIDGTVQPLNDGRLIITRL